MSTFRTPKGTELPFLNLKGKDYLQVAHRIVWFREDHPDWTIETSIHTLNNEVAIVSAEITDSAGKTLARGHKMQTAKGFPGGYLEKAESGAVGRALAFLGYGTAHAQELEDEDANDLSTFADTPLPPKNKPISSIMPFGPDKGRTLPSITTDQITSALNWAKKNNKFIEFQREATIELSTRQKGALNETKTQNKNQEQVPPHLQDIPY